jgi:hypothetical protein
MAKYSSDLDEVWWWWVNVRGRRYWDQKFPNFSETCPRHFYVLMENPSRQGLDFQATLKETGLSNTQRELPEGSQMGFL